ncbi:Ubiquinone biosynthesis protein COQ9 [Gracilaria domingensis]|nr:Ubiquinone biosynthesis protein COQ9 [Gracilaria domingensis]
MNSFPRLWSSVTRITIQPSLKRNIPKCFTASSSTQGPSVPTGERPESEKKATATVDHEANDDQKTNNEDEELIILFDAVLKQVPSHGWTDRSIAAAVEGLGWSPASTQMIPRGPIQVVEEFVKRSNVNLAKRLAQEDEKDAAAAGGRDPVGRATFAIRERLEMIEPHHHNWANALALQIHPQNSRKALKSSALLMDEIAHYAGYRDADVSIMEIY